ncbi:MAG: sugar phosphate isomerase/epimerase [Fuerstiella sp.]|nr:sugar phosphate isomerase/epimerase [Fuerstiella sp.]
MPKRVTFNRRQALGALAGSAAATVMRPNRADAADENSGRTSLGLVRNCCRLRRDFVQQSQPSFDLYEPLNFLAYCRELGAGGMQIELGADKTQEAKHLRKIAETSGMYIEAIINPPRNNQDIQRFDAEMKQAVAAGAKAVRTVIISGRRYEYFDSLNTFREFEARGRRSLELAAPIAEKHRLPLAVENHKDHRNDERVALFRHIDSEFVGACVDTGNSFALLESPIETVRALAPWAHSVHLKDQAVQITSDGFWLGDIPLGQGFLDLESMVKILRHAKPNIHFSLELITRDPIKVPVLTQKYWATFPDVPGRDLARTLRTVHESAAEELPYVTSLSPEKQVEREHTNVRASLTWARDHLGL